MFETFSAIALVIIFLVPGYLWRSTEGQFVYLDHRLPWEKFALGLLTRSTLIYLPFLPWLIKGYEDKWHTSHPFWVTAAAIGFIAALPVFLGLFTGIARQKDWFGHILKWNWIDWLLNKTRLKTFSHHRVPTAWDAVFNSDLKETWVVVTRKNGQQIYGLLGPGSHMSVDPEDRDLFLSKTLYFKDKGGGKGEYKFVPGTMGVYIKADEISTVELIDRETQQEN